MSEQLWSSEERRVALEQVSRMISERVEKARVQRGDISVEVCEDHQAMQVAIELQCRLTSYHEAVRKVDLTRSLLRAGVISQAEARAELGLVKGVQIV